MATGSLTGTTAATTCAVIMTVTACRTGTTVRLGAVAEVMSADGELYSWWVM